MGLEVLTLHFVQSSGPRASIHWATAFRLPRAADFVLLQGGPAEDLLAGRPLALEFDSPAQQLFDRPALVQNGLALHARVAVLLQAVVEAVVAEEVLEAAAAMPEILVPVAEIVVAAMEADGAQIFQLAEVEAAAVGPQRHRRVLFFQFFVQVDRVFRQQQLHFRTERAIDRC